MIKSERIERLNGESQKDRDFVLYWMQASQRPEDNKALNLAIEKANEANLPVVTYFGITDDFPGANLRHYHFMVEGLTETIKKLEERGIKTVVEGRDPPEGVIELAESASAVVVDRGYLRIQKRWRRKVAEEIDVELLQVEGDVVVPVEAASEKEEYAARTIRPKINEQLDDFLNEEEHSVPGVSSLDLELPVGPQSPKSILDDLEVDRSVGPAPGFTGGTSEAKQLLDDFIADKLDEYGEMSNDPTADSLSKMSPYLHFGQISPLYIASRIKEADSPGGEDYLEQLIVRRELSINFVHYNENYDDFGSILPDWAYETLMEHEDDEREYLYTLEEFENAETHDPYWNAAQKEMNLTGKTHGYMRMYWGKKILEWTPNPEQGYEISLYLNNKYELDGRDPNGFTGVAWCYGKHDQGWKERPVFGKTRYMNANGLERKFDAEEYVKKINRIEEEIGKNSEN